MQPSIDRPRARAVSRACLIAVLLSALQAHAAAADAAGLFQQAQNAFRSGDTAEALALYQRADAAGFSDPVLFFNVGVACYQLGHYDAARDAFLTASATPDLAAVSFYNLGLVARRLGDDHDAAAWFEQTIRHPRAPEKLRALARKAKASLGGGVTRKRPLAYESLEQPSLGDHLRVAANTGFAADSNVYRSPSHAYVDLADPAAPTVVPVVQSGTYVPVQAQAEFRWGTHEDSHFDVRYGLDGRIYTSADLANANEIEHALAMGGEVNRSTTNGAVYWRSHFVVTRSNEQAYDRDDGQDQLVGTEDVSDRFSHTRFGPNAYYHRDLGRLGFGFRMDAAITRYDETLDFLDLTNEQYLGGVHLSLRPLRRTLVELSGDYYQRLYADRTAKDSSGIRFVNNDNLEYHYQNVGVSVRQQMHDALLLGFDYRYTQRKDVFEHYDDYDCHTGRAYLRFGRGRWSARASFTYRSYDFPNAFAFDNVTAGERTLKTAFGELQMEFRVSRRFAIKAEATMDAVKSTDSRTEYDRNQLAAGLIWRM